MTDTGSESETAVVRRSVRFAKGEYDGEETDQLVPLSNATEANKGKSPLHHRRTSSHSLQNSLMRTHVKERDPLFYYEVLNVVGVGSMGSVATVRKRDHVVGGSARKEVVDSFRKKKQREHCFQIPIFGPLFRFCVEGVIGSASSVFSSERSTETGGSSHTGSKRDVFFSSSDRSLDSAEIVKKYEMTYAMKSIHLNRIHDESFVDELRNEIEILKKLDHPHIVRPIETFDHRNQLFIVMELCSGGDLYSRDPYTEEEAARIVSDILSAVAYMHSKNITHRDLKYENVLFVNNSPKAEIKLIDFGLSRAYGFGKKALSDGVGTIYTMAPEVLRGHYTYQADLWSIGVITYMLLSSQMPFYGRKRRHIVEQIMQCKYDFHGRRWKRVSSQAKAFVQDLLVDNPEERATAEEASGSVWLNRGFSATVRGPTEDEMETTKNSLNSFASYSKLKKLALLVIAHKSTTEEIGILRKIFEQYDRDNSGAISFEEFKAALGSYGYSHEEAERMFDGVDVDGTGEIKYCEFLAASIEAHGAINEERLAEAFDRLDSDDSGYISADNLREMLGSEFPQEEIDEIIKEVDITKDNKISYPEFLALWEDKNEEKRENMIEILQDHKATLANSSSHVSLSALGEQFGFGQTSTVQSDLEYERQ